MNGSGYSIGLFTYDTVSEAIDNLIKRGYTKNFSICDAKECLTCDDPYLYVFSDEFEIDEIHRFDGPTDPADEMILYAVSTSDIDIKGFFLSAYGIHANTSSTIITNKSIKYTS